MTITSFTRRDLVSLMLILIAAAFMRFGRPDVVEYFHDDGMLATLAQEMADGRAFHLTGIISSTGIPNPPTSVYALLPFFWISRDPVFAIYGIMALNVIGVGLLWAIAHRYFGRAPAIMAGIAYAVNPWAVLYSRKLWAQDYHTPFFLFGLMLALYGFMEGEGQPAPRSGRFWAQVFSLPILLFAMQIHFAAWALFPLYLIPLWMGRKRIARKSLIWSAVLSFIVLLPYGIGLMQTLQQDPTRISDAAGRTQAREGFLTVDAFFGTWSLASFQYIETWVAPEQKDAFRQEAGVQFFDRIFIMMILNGLLYLTRTKHPLRWWIIWWAFGPVILLTFNLTKVYPHYFIASLPVYSVLIGLIVGPVLFLIEPQPPEKSKPPKRRWYWFGRALEVFYYVLLIAAFITQPIYWNSTLDYLDNHHVPYPGFTTPLHYLTDIRDALKDETDVVVLSDGMAWDLNHEVSVWDTLLYDKSCVRTLRGDGYAVLPDHPFAVLVASNAEVGVVQGFYSAGTPEIFPERHGGGEYKIYRWQTVPTWPYADLTSITPARFANDVELVGYNVGESTVTLAWHLPQGQRGENVQYTVQFFDAGGNRVGQGDKVFWQSQHWCAGDTLLTWLDVPRDETATIMRVGFYKLLPNGGYSPVAALDANGQSMGDMAEFALP